MALTWWPVAVAGFACLAAVVALAMLLPMEQLRRQLRPLANTTRLTRLPEYARLARARSLSMVLTIVLLALLFGAVVLASARPSGWWWSLGTSTASEDIMLCVGDPVTDQVTGEFLAYFAQQARTYGTQRIGLTSPNRRVVPLTRDYQYAAGKFTDLAELSQPQGQAMRNRIASFSPPVSYVDYAPSVADILTLCMTGFPSFESTSSHRRSLIYLGPSEIRRQGETRPSLFTDQQAIDMASKAGIQVNALASSAPGPVQWIVESTGGQYVPVDAADLNLPADLDTIRDNAPDPSEPVGMTLTGWFGDSPTIPLTVAVVVSTLLSLCLVVLRR